MKNSAVTHKHSHTNCSCSSASCGISHEHEHNHEQADGCGCGHEHGHEEADGCGCGHEHGGGDSESRRGDIISIAISAAIAIPVSIFIQNAILKAVLMIAAILIAGLPIFIKGAKNIFKLDFEELSLLTIAVTAACFIGEYPEALLVTALFRIGEMLEDIAIARSRREVEAITKIIPENANLVLADGSTQLVGAKQLKIGDTIIIKSGERVPVDGNILAGESSLNTSSLTGESTPREVKTGDTVLSGAVNLGGVLTVATTSTFDNSTASKIISMVKDAAAKKGKTEKMISRFARIYTPIVIIISILVAVLPPLLGLGEFTDWLGRALVLLVAACPCALVISVPLAFFAGIGAASKQGVLIKGSRYIEALASAQNIVFDKTGTLTTGVLTVKDIHALGESSEQEVLRLAAICESYSNHPIAKAIVNKYGHQEMIAQNVEEITSFGVSAVIDNSQILCGSAKLMQKFGADISSLNASNVYVAKNGVAIGAISLFDNPRSDAAATISSLKNMGIENTIMLTGDDTAAAEEVKSMIGIDKYHARLLPQDKVLHLEKIKAEYSTGTTLFVGDGVNDAPVLAMSDAGIAMGMGSDSAIEAADVVLLSDSLSSLPQAIRISRKTSALAKFNVTFALAVKLIVFVLALFNIASMWLAVFADVGVSIIAVINATRALKFK